MPDDGEVATYLDVPSSIKAGATASASVVIVNSTGKDLVAPIGSSVGLWQVWLGNDDIPNEPALPAVAGMLSRPYVVPVGETRLAFELSARRNSYGHFDGRDGASEGVAGFPPLPPGLYSARFYGRLTGDLPNPHEVSVQVLDT